MSSECRRFCDGSRCDVVSTLLNEHAPVISSADFLVPATIKFMLEFFDFSRLRKLGIGGELALSWAGTTRKGRIQFTVWIVVWGVGYYVLPRLWDLPALSAYRSTIRVGYWIMAVIVGYGIALQAVPLLRLLRLPHRR
jgi:hypothetical protein